MSVSVSASVFVSVIVSVSVSVSVSASVSMFVSMSVSVSAAVFLSVFVSMSVSVSVSMSVSHVPSISTCQAGGPERASKIIALQFLAFNDCPLSFLIWPRARASKRATSQTRLGILRGTILVPSLWFGVVPRLVRVAIISDDVENSRQTCQSDALHKRMQSATPLSTDPMQKRPD